MRGKKVKPLRKLSLMVYQQRIKDGSLDEKATPFKRYFRHTKRIYNKKINKK